MLLIAALTALVRGGTALAPSWPALVLDRVLGDFTAEGSFYGCKLCKHSVPFVQRQHARMLASLRATRAGFQTILAASLADTHTEKELAVAGAGIKAFMGVGLLAAPVAGAFLLERDIRLPFAASAVLSLANVWLLSSVSRMPETAAAATAAAAMAAGAGNAVGVAATGGGSGSGSGSGGGARRASASASPLGFLVLFTSGASLRLLTITAGLQAMVRVLLYVACEHSCVRVRAFKGHAALQIAARC